ncbi:PorV/PorQ family protein [candidate division KSB1 bacterium]|nr:PorV/PorQ family protein [candidate division KSB1 bacterium]
MNFRKNIINQIFLPGLILTGCFSLMAQSKVGTTAVPFLGISICPRATAMGGAFAAVGEDVTSLYYNPGAVSRFGRSQFSAAHTGWLVDSKLNWVGLVINLDGINAIGLSVTQLNYGEEIVTTVSNPEGTGENWGASDLAASFSYARNLTDRFSIGGSVKYIQEKIWNESATAFAVDVGLLFITQFNDMRLGMSISNFGTDMRMDGRDLLKSHDLDPDALGHNETIPAKLKTGDWPLPLLFRVGVAMNVIEVGPHHLMLAVDALRPSDNTEILNVGGELVLQNMVFLRAGYKSLFRENSEEGLTFGCGLNMPLGPSLSWQFDYTYADFGLFEQIQMFSVGLMF